MDVTDALRQASGKADALVEALPYIRRFRGKVVVVQVDGSVLDDDRALADLLTDIVFMNRVGVQPVLVHGGGRAVDDATGKAGLEPQWVHGRRYTDERALAVAEHVLCNQVNRHVVTVLRAAGAEAMGLHTLATHVLTAERTFLPGPGTRRIDLGSVGRVCGVNGRLVHLLARAGAIPCIAAIARDAAGQRLTVNAAAAAAAVATAMAADKLVVVGDAHGVVADRLTVAEAEQMMLADAIAERARPDVNACVDAIRGGVPTAHLVDRRTPHALLLEVYTQAGIGTQIEP